MEGERALPQLTMIWLSDDTVITLLTFGHLFAAFIADHDLAK